MQRAIYGAGTRRRRAAHRPAPPTRYAFYLEKLGIGALVSGRVLALGLWVYHRLSADFAEEL